MLAVALLVSVNFGVVIARCLQYVSKKAKMSKVKPHSISVHQLEKGVTEIRHLGI